MHILLLIIRDISKKNPIKAQPIGLQISKSKSPFDIKHSFLLSRDDDDLTLEDIKSNLIMVNKNVRNTMWFT